MISKRHPNEFGSTFCILPWIHLSTRPNGHVRVCCTANASSAGKTNDKEFGGEVGIIRNNDGSPANLGKNTISEIWNSEYMKRVRRQMLSGEIPPSCTKCFREEAAGHRSKRIWETEYWTHRLDLDEILSQTSSDGSVPNKVYYIDLRLGTKCNLKCIMCSPHDSAKWIPDWRKLHPQIESASLKETMQWPNEGRVDGASYNWHEENPHFWQDLELQLPHLEQLYFAGGESTIIQEHYNLLERCIQSGSASHIELRYNSNGIELTDRLFALWTQFKRVRFHFSLDSIGEMNSYIRYPSQWATIEKNLRLLDESPASVEVTIACAVQALNIFYIPDFIQWKLKQNYRKINPWPLGAGLINFHFVYHPPHLNVRVLPDWMKKKVTEKYESFYPLLEQHFKDQPGFVDSPYGISRLKGLVNFMNTGDWSNRLPEFREYIQLMDKIRGTDFRATFPEMAPLLDQ